MLRLTGILTGSALAIGFLIVTLGVPEFSTLGPETVQEAMAAPEAEPEIEVIAEPEPGPEAQTAARANPEPISESIPATETEALIEQIFAPELEPDLEDNWYAFWSPFRSEIAANGFVSRLQQTTGIDYRVVKVRTGVYEVAFAYSDDADIQDKLATISAATGLDMTGG
jgi:hypothetical protein